jgi:hypothetical protein
VGVVVLAEFCETLELLFFFLVKLESWFEFLGSAGLA